VTKASGADSTLHNRELDELRRQVELSYSRLSAEPPARVQPPPAVEGESVWHFSYGANMNYYTLAQRGVRVLSRDAAHIVDKNTRMVFTHRGGYATLETLQEPSTAEAVQRPQRFPPLREHVHGVLYKLSKDDLKRLSEKEGGYKLQEVEVETYDGKRHIAMAYVSSSMAKLPTEVMPTETYMRLLREGAADNYLDPLYQAWLSSIETVPSAGLGAEYWNTPSKFLAYSFLGVVALVAAAVFTHA
jgi:gamma-glutamylcyclotransferase (GGCT)/AIG2-like uncharacterized protein YtfP